MITLTTTPRVGDTIYVTQVGVPARVAINHPRTISAQPLLGLVFHVRDDGSLDAIVIDHNGTSSTQLGIRRLSATAQVPGFYWSYRDGPTATAEEMASSIDQAIHLLEDIPAGTLRVVDQAYNELRDAYVTWRPHLTGTLRRRPEAHDYEVISDEEREEV